jgi:hypothetical protein
MEAIMRRLITTGFICIIATMCICTFLTIKAIENIADTLDKAESAPTITYNQPVVEDATYEEPEEEIVPVYYEKQEDGDMIYEFGDMSDDAYFFIIINEEQGVYEYYWPAMSEDWPLEYDSLAELQDSVICHIDQEWPNATFAMLVMR